MRVSLFSSLAHSGNAGVWAGFAAYTMWGSLPLYWHLLQPVSPFLVLCHRIVWSLVFLVPLTVLTGRMPEVIRAAKDRKTLCSLFVSSVILAVNWGVFIWAVNNGRVVEASLGYFICPLVTISMGVLFFRDRPSRLCRLAVGVAFSGILAEVLLNGAVPWTGLCLAFSFAAYSLMRKLQSVESLPGLSLETLTLFPFALGFVFWNQASMGMEAWGVDAAQTLLFMGAGVVTATPLILVAYAARHITMTALSVLQYIYPVLAALLGLFVFNEPLSAGRAVSFAAVCAALVLYTTDSLRQAHAKTK